MPTKNDLIKKYGLSSDSGEESVSSEGSTKDKLIEKYGLPSTGDRKKDLLRKYGIVKIDDDPEYYINKYMQDYNDFYGKWNSAAQNAGWADAMSGSMQMNTEYADINRRSDEIRDYLDKNRDWINRDYYNSVMSDLKNAGSWYQSLQGYYNNLKDYYGQWGSQEEYDAWMRDYEAQQEYDLYQQNKQRLEELKADRGSRNGLDNINSEIEKLQAAVDEYESGIWGAEGHVADAKRYLTTSNAPASDGLTAEEREHRLTEIESQISDLRTENASLGPSMSYESAVNIDRKKHENNQKISELEEEKRTLLLAGSTTEREYIELQHEFARQDYSDAVGKALSNAKVGPSESLSAIQNAGLGSSDANAEVLRTTDLLDWMDYVDKYSGKKYDDNFFGQYAANRTIGRMSQDSSLFWNAYLDDPSEENRRMAETADELIERFSLVNSETLADDATLSWISKDLANYMPQFWDQLKYKAGGALLGAAATLGNPTGAKAGYVAGSSLYGLQTMRGAAFRELIKAGVDENTARAAAMDEAIISSIIEAGDAVLDLFTMGAGKVIDIFTDGGATALKKAATTVTGKNAVRKLIAGLGKYLLNAGGEYVEESTQEAVSISNLERDTAGILDLAGRALKTYLLMFYNPESKEDQEKKEQMQEAGEGGLRLGLMLGGAEIVGNATIGNAVRNARAEMAVGDLRPQLQEMTAKALELNPEDTAALRVQNRMNSGKNVSGMDIYNMLVSYEGSVKEKDAGIVQEAAASRLEALGETGDVNTIAAAIAKQITGQELTRNERLAIKDSKYWQRVVNELNPENMVSGDYSSDWAHEYEALRDVTQQYSRDLSGVTAAQDAQNIAARLIRDGATAKEANKTANQLAEDSKLYGKQSKVYTDTYIPGQDTTQYKLQYAQVYRMGQDGIDKKYVAEYSKGLTDSQRDVIYSAGQDSVRDKQSREVDLDTDDLDVNADGKTLRQDTGEEIQIEDFDTTGTVKTSGGGSVDVSRISFASMDDAVLYSTISKVSSSAIIANSLLRQFRGQTEMSAIDFAAGLMEAYDAGRIGDVTLQELAKSEFAGKLNVAQREAAYNRGKRMGYQDAYRRQQDVKKKSGGKKEGNLHFDRKGRKFDSMREQSLAVMETLSKALGVDIYVFESYVNKDGKRVYMSDRGEKKAPNGFYDPSDSSIHIDLNAGQSGHGTMLFTVAHELTHFIKDWSSVKYRAMADMLVKQYQKQGVSVSELVDNQIAKAKQNGREMSRSEAFDEVVADSMESMLADENAAAFLDRLAQRDKGLKEKVVGWLKDLAAKLKNALTAYKDVKPDSTEGKIVAEMEDFRKEIMGIYTSALVDAGENFRENGGNLTSDGDYLYSGRVTDKDALEQAGIDVDEKTESVVPSLILSERTWTESDYIQNRDQAAREISNAIGISVQKAKKYIDDVNSIAKMIADDRTRLDYFSSPGRSSFVSNVEYGGSFDFSTLCKKRRLLTGTFTAIQKALPNTALTANEILEIRNRMKEAGLEVSCGLCYVEGSRANMGQFAKEFLRLYKQYYPDSWQPNMADVNTPDGIEWVRINHPEVYEQYEYFWNHYGKLKSEDKNLFASQQKPKLYQLHTEYNGEILKNFRNDNRVEEKNRNGGIRLQSFSDFEIVHLIDTMQIIMDMSRVGLAGQAYTKVADFAWALGDTGLKINLSLIAKGVDQNGKLIFDDVEGMQFEEAMRLRSRYSKNVGTILVVFNDEQLYAAMADDRIDFIIPFHRSQWKKSQYSAMGLPANTKDYTYMQNEKYIRPQYHEYRGHMVRDKATNYMPNEYWDFGKTGKENAEAYLDLCAKNNKRPKFYKLLKDNGDGSYSLKDDGSTDGYWKLLIDFKMYDNDGNGSPQVAVKPDFNMEESRRMLNDYRGGHSSFPAANGIVDQFVSEYKESHKGVQFSDRDPTAEATRVALEKENGKLRDDVSRLRELLRLQGKVTGGTVMKQSSIEAASRWLNKYAGSRADVKELSGMLKDFYSFLAADKDYSWEDVRERAMGIARVIQDNVQIKHQISDYARDVLREVRGIKITLDEQQRAEVEYLYGSYEAFRKAALGTVTFVKEGGIPLDSQWQEWSAMFPGTFDSEINSNDQPAALLDAIDALRNSDTTVMEYAYNREGILQDIMRAVYDSYWRVDALVTVADRDQKKMNAIKAKQDEKVQDLKGKISDKNARINQLRAEHRAEMENLKKQQRQTVAELKQKRQEDIKKLRTDYRKKLEDTRSYYQESRKAAVESRKKTIIRNKIKAIGDEFRKMIDNPGKADSRHAPSGLVRAVAEVCEMLADSSQRANVRMLDELQLRQQQLDAKNKSLGETKGRMVEAETIAKRNEQIVKATQKVKALQEHYAKMKDDPNNAGAYDEHVSGLIDKLGKELSGTDLYDMTKDQLEDVYNTMKAVRKAIVDANKVISMGHTKLLSEVVKIMSSQIDQVDVKANGLAVALRRYAMWQMSPDTFFDYICGYIKNNEGQAVQKMFSNGTSRMLTVQREFSNRFRHIFETDNKANMKALMQMTKHQLKDMVDWGLKDADGKTVRTSRGMMLQAYMLLKQKDSFDSIVYGGLKLPKAAEYYKGNIDNAYGDAGYTDLFSQAAGEGVDSINRSIRDLKKELEAEDVSDSRRAEINSRISQLEQEGRDLVSAAEKRATGLLEDIEKNLTSFEREIIQEADTWYGYTGKLMADVYEQMYGYRPKLVDNYVRIHRDLDSIKIDIRDTDSAFNLENSGFTKERVKSTAPILLTDFFAELNSQKEQISRYYGFAQVQKDFNRIWNLRIPGGRMTLKEKVGLKFGKGDTKTIFGVSGEKYVENYIASVAGGKRQKGLFDGLYGNMASATLSLNPRVAVSQLASIPTASAVVGWKSMVKGFAKGGMTGFSKTKKRQLAQNSEWFYYRYKGAGGITEIAELNARGGIWSKISSSKVGKWLFNWCQDFDVFATSSMWAMAEDYVQSKGFKASDDGYQAEVARVYEDIIRKSQPNYTETERSDFLRDKRSGMRLFNMFKTQSNQNLNILLDANGRYMRMRSDLKNGRNGVTQSDVKAAGANLANAITSVSIGGTLTFVLLRTAVNFLIGAVGSYQDDDTDEIDKDELLKSMGKEMLSSFSGMFALGGTVYDIVNAIVSGDRYYGLSDSAIGAISDALESVVSAVQMMTDENEEIEWGKIEEAVNSILTASGVPYGNAKKILNGIEMWYRDIKNGDLGKFTSGKTSDKQYRGRILDGYRNGDQEKIGDSLAMLIANSDEDDEEEAEKKVLSGMKNYLKALYVKDQVTGDEVRGILEDIFGMDDKDLYWILDSWDYQRENGTTDGYNKYNDLYQTVLSGGDISEVMADLTEHGYNERDVLSNLKGQVEEWFHAENPDERISEAQASSILKTYLHLKDGEVNEIIRHWKMEIETGIAYGDLKQAFIDQDVTAEEARRYLNEYGSMTEYEARKQVEDWDFEAKHGYAYSDIKSTYLDDEITRAEAIDVMVGIGGKTRDEAEQKVAYWDYEDKTGVDYENKASQYKRGIITRQQLKAALIALGDYTDDDADIQIEVYDWQQDGLQAASFSRVEKWHEYCEPAGVSKSMWLQIALFSANTKNDVDRNGNTVSYSAMKKVMAKIDALPITAAQKTAIAKAIGWSDKNIAKYKPW